jgi:predicted esterase
MKLVLGLLSFPALTLCALALAGDKPAKPKSDPAPAGDTKEHAIDAPDVADIPTQDLRIAKDDKRRYLLDGPRQQDKQPKDGFGLLIVMPGGDGSADFHPFVKRIYKNAVPDGFLVVQPVAPKWTEKQQIVWPTDNSKVDGMKFSTEEFVAQVIEEIGKTQKLDPARVYTLSWSSSGPAAYVIAAQKKPLVRGSLIAMSVFHPADFDIANVKERPYYILHSPDDKVCPFKMAEEARDALRKAGARVEFATYEGGHGWQGDVFGNIKAGLDWLEKPPAKK